MDREPAVGSNWAVMAKIQVKSSADLGLTNSGVCREGSSIPLMGCSRSKKLWMPVSSSVYIVVTRGISPTHMENSEHASSMVVRPRSIGSRSGPVSNGWLWLCDLK